MKLRIAIADDDPEILATIAAGLEKNGYTFDQFRNGKDVLNALRRDTYDVVLVDWNMPGATGFEIVTWGTANLEHPPAFILLTSRSGKGDVVDALEHGASDYIVKPESSEVIVARIEAAARRVQKPQQKDRHQHFDNYSIDARDEVISLNGKPAKLTAKEFQLAKLFFENLDRPLSRAYIYSTVWGGAAEVTTRTLDMHVSRVRSKLELRPRNGFVIRTVFGFGYRMDKYEDDDS